MKTKFIGIIELFDINNISIKDLIKFFQTQQNIFSADALVEFNSYDHDILNVFEIIEEK